MHFKIAKVEIEKKSCIFEDLLDALLLLWWPLELLIIRCCSKHRLAEQSNWVTHKQHNIISSKPWPSYQCNQRVISYTRGWLRVWKMSTLTGGYIMLLKVTFANSAGVLLENVLNLVGFSFGSTMTMPVQIWYCKTNGLLLQVRLCLPEYPLKTTENNHEDRCLTKTSCQTHIR